MRVVRTVIVAVALLFGGGISAQTAAPPVNVFLDCQASGCDTSHFRSEIPFVNWVRDRTVADVYLLITSQGTGSGGTTYALSYMGQRSFSADTLELGLTTGQTMTDALRRDALTNRIAQGLLTFAVRTDAAARVRVSMQDAAEGEAEQTAPVDDPWNAWVFSLGVSADASGESRRSSTEVDIEAEADRVTRDWRFGFEVDGSYERDRRELTDRTIRILTRNYSGYAQLVKSLAPLWSAGIRTSAGTSTFRNQDFYARVAPVLEYSFFPYEDFSRRRATLQYSAGVNYYDYTEETLFNRMTETVYDEALSLSVQFRQPWGSASAYLEGSHYFHDVSRYSLSSEGRVDVRLLRGLSAQFGASYSRVHDQLYIQKGDATDEEVLLERIALGTDYEYSVWAGVNFTFGSIYNNIVNTRIQ